MFRGNKQLGNSNQLNLKMEEMGGDMNAVTSFDLTEYWLDYHIDYCKTGMERFCHFLREPLFENIELERSIILEELKADYNENDQLIDLDSISAAEIWKNHGLGFPVSGTRSSITRITHNELNDWYNKYYQPGNMLIGMAGDIDPEATFRFFSENILSAIPSRRRNYANASRADIDTPLLLIENKDNQYSLQWSFLVYPLTRNLRIHYQLIRRILDDGSSSRLQRLIREEKGLVYDVSADMLYFNSGALLSINSLIGLNRLPELIAVVADLFRSLIDKGVTSEELDLAKRRYRIALDCNQDSPQGLLFEAMAPLIHPCINSYQQILEELSAISLVDINETLRTLLHQDRTCFAMVGPSAESHRQMLEKSLASWLQM